MLNKSQAIMESRYVRICEECCDDGACVGELETADDAAHIKNESKLIIDCRAVDNKEAVCR